MQINDIHIHVHVHGKSVDEELFQNVFTLTKSIHSQNLLIMQTQAEAVQVLNQVSEKLTKIKGETGSLLDKVAALEEAANNQPNLTPELAAAIENVRSQAQGVDDLVADAPVVDGGTGDNTGSGPEGGGGNDNTGGTV
jgi:hypothetical protein